MKVDRFTPAKNQVLVKMEFFNSSDGGILYKEPRKDLFGTVMAVGPEVSDKTNIGDRVMFGDIAMLQLPFRDKDNKQILCVLAPEFQIMGYYKPLANQKKIFVPDDVVEEVETREGISLVGGDGRLGEWAQENEDLIN